MGSSSCCGNKLERCWLRGGRESLGAFQTLGKLERNSVTLVQRRGPRCGASMCCRNAYALKHQSKTCSRYCGSARSRIASITHSNESPGNKPSRRASSWPTPHNIGCLGVLAIKKCWGKCAFCVSHVHPVGSKLCLLACMSWRIVWGSHFRPVRLKLSSF